MSSNKAVAGKIIEAWKLIGSIEKKGRNPKFNYAFVREEDAADALRNAFIKVGLSLMPSVEKLERSVIKTSSGGEQQHVIITMRFTLTDKDTGESDSFIMVGEAADSFDKATYKAITGCTKYAYTKLAMSGAEDNEDDTREEQKDVKTGKSSVQEIPAGQSYRKPDTESKPTTKASKSAEQASPPPASAGSTAGTKSAADKPMSTRSEPDKKPDLPEGQSYVPTTEDEGTVTAVIPAMKGKPATISFKPEDGRPVYAINFDPSTTKVPELLKLQQGKAKMKVYCDISSGNPFLMRFEAA